VLKQNLRRIYTYIRFCKKLSNLGKALDRHIRYKSAGKVLKVERFYISGIFTGKGAHGGTDG
jgi:hypothetical protein